MKNLFSKKDQKKLWIPARCDTGQTDGVTSEIATWIHPSGHLGFVLYNGRGIVFDRLKNKNAAAHADICAWCMTANSAASIALFTRKTSDDKTHGIRLCADLDCLSSIANPNPNSMPETLSRDARIARYYKNLERYCAEII